ncbi:elongation factor P [Qipengyuania sp. MTN3-11]|uniref:elongation factor P n=1 Tax=Qipengyuania sp. MTN3-11 TaxID=3056557 RepID=UPI0036F2B7B3
MKRAFTAAAALAALAVSSTAPLAAHDRLGTLPHGRYVCALPGDATGLPVKEISEHNFAITGASSYEASEGRGTYLKVGDTVTFTRGPRKDMKLKLLPSGLLQWVKEDGSLGRIRCSRVGR